MTPPYFLAPSYATDCYKYLVKLSKEEHVWIVCYVSSLDVSQGMEDNHHKLPDRFDPLSPNKQNLSLVLVENGVSERIFLVVVRREVGGQQECDLGGSYRLVEETDDENTEAVDDEVAGADAVDVHRF